MWGASYWLGGNSWITSKSFLENENKSQEHAKRGSSTLDEDENYKDQYTALQAQFPEFKQGVLKMTEWSYTGAIDLFNEVSPKLSNNIQKSILDFNIAQSQYEIDRKVGGELFVTLSKNESYPKRTRALALQRAYLLYVKYNDPLILKQIIDWYGKKAWNIQDASTQIMQMQYTLNPHVGSALYIASQLIQAVPIDKPEMAKRIYYQYNPSILKGIKFTKNNPGELTEATSAMLGRANLIANLYIRFKIIPRTEVEAAYKELIEFDQENWLPVNQQYALLYYADFLAEIKDATAVIWIMAKITKQNLQTALLEALPRSQEFLNLKAIPLGTIDSASQELVDYIGSANTQAVSPTQTLSQ